MLANAFGRTLDDFLDDLEAELEITDSQYEAAERSYKSVGDWLNRPGSNLAAYDPSIYVQGSFRLGTAIKPLGEDDEYDVDAVCQLKRFTKQHGSQAKLKELLGRDLQAYASARNMLKPVEERRRCWTLHYADEAQFHLDVVPAVPNAAQQRALLAARGLPTNLTETAISITDKTHPQYRNLSDDWPRSNPKGYAEWFKSRMASVFERRKRIIALNQRADVENIPDYKVRTPLQSAIKFLKRHRDIMFSGDMTDAPISIILTTLAAHAYQGEETTSAALDRILADMPRYIIDHYGVSIVANPSDPLENFADKWAEFPTRKTAFFEWLDRVRKDFAAAASAYDRQGVGRALATSMGTALTERALNRSGSKSLFGSITSFLTEAKDLVLNASHRRRPRWPQSLYGSVSITSASFTRDGFRSVAIASNGPAVQKKGSLRFEATTNISEPFKVYWQVVNTGREAERVRGLRGNFDYVERGGLTKTEGTQYAGTHAIECFIVKDGVLVARSGPFFVTIQ
jgi:hypothetical protein